MLQKSTIMAQRRKRWSIRRPKLKKRPQPGATPGTLTSDHGAAPTTVELIGYSRDQFAAQQVTDLKQLKSLAQKHQIAWVNVTGLADHNALRMVAEAFGIHTLALEDVVHVHQRSKVDEYDGMLYVVVREVESTEPFNSEQVSIFLGERFVITFQERPGDSFEPIRAQLKQPGTFLRDNCKTDHLAYRLIDAVVDSYFPMIEKLGDKLDELDDAVTNHPPASIVTDVHQMRSELLLVRRAIWPHRDAINSLLRDKNPLIDDATRTFLHDVYDHTVQLIDLVESYREICTDLRDYYMTSISNRMNEIMKVLTIISTLFIPLSFITGVYGMNFNTAKSKWNMPELDWVFGYPFAWGLILAVAGGMLLFFKRRGWFDGPDEPKNGKNVDEGRRDG
jgi:magnesium transporter